MMTIQLPDAKNANLQIFNMLGEMVQHQDLMSAGPNEVNISARASGIYFYRLQDAGKVLGSGKLVVE